MLFHHPYRALVIGASGAIGAAFVEAFQHDDNCSYLESVSRSSGSGFDVTVAQSIKEQAAICASGGPYNIIVDATGALKIGGVGPEKSLSAVSVEQLTAAFQVNAIGPIMVLQQFAPLLAPSRSIYAKLSARLGSIADNQVGGWYGYRASKAALNMLLHTAAIELQRGNPSRVIAALQPGTVRSRLSSPYTSRVENLLEPAASVAGMLQAVGSLQPKRGAYFIDYRGMAIAW
jgi:NAD(P)-dependent dehydrogenase (short-subunit alcohol dehydrogenase family)